MRSPHVTADDLTTRARIRHAAVVRFGTEGFGVGLRAIAADAGVSPALIVRHFGSKAGLRRACDEDVLRLIRETKSESVATGSPGAILGQLARIEEYGPAVLYVVASLHAGGQLARDLLDHMAADAEEYLAAAEANGVVRPSRDPAARARYLTQAGLGALLLQVRLEQGEGDLDIATVMRVVERETLLPALELYTYGLLTDATILETVLAAHGEDTAAGPPAPGSRPGDDAGPAADAPHAAPHDVAPDPPRAASA